MEKFNYLLNNEYSVLDLSNELQYLECEDICNFGNWSQILEDRNVVVATDKYGDNHIQIFFEVTIKNGKEEIPEASEIKILTIEEF